MLVLTFPAVVVYWAQIFNWLGSLQLLQTATLPDLDTVAAGKSGTEA